MKTKKSFRGNLLLGLFLGTIGISCNFTQTFAQDTNKNKANKPDVKYKVNKEYDDKGNVIRYDSTYSYSWSENGQNPQNIDSLLKNFNQQFFFSFGNDSTFDHMKSMWPFSSDSIFSHFPNFDNQFDEFFNGNPFPINPFFDDDDNFFQGNEDMKNLFDKHQQLMQKFLKDFYFNKDSIIELPRNKTPIKPEEQGKTTPKKQNYFPPKSNEKTVSV